jgi:RNA polymerase sigma factor (sigma-70 family)
MIQPANKDVFLDLIEANKGIIYKVSNSYCKDVEDRKDLVQEIIIQLWRSFERYDDRYKLSTWMYRIALNVAISFFRKEHKRKSSASPISESVIETTADEGPGELESNLYLLQQFIYELQELDRALMLLYLEDRNYKEIADILEITETNVATKISRIKDRLRQKFSRINNE